MRAGLLAGIILCGVLGLVTLAQDGHRARLRREKMRNDARYAGCVSLPNMTDHAESVASRSGRRSDQEVARYGRSGADALWIFPIAVYLLALVLLIASRCAPMVWSARQFAQQKETAIRIQSLALALEAYATDHNEYPDASVASLEVVLRPYMRVVRLTDGWGRPIYYATQLLRSSADEPPVRGIYVVASSGYDGVLTTQSRSLLAKASTILCSDWYEMRGRTSRTTV